MQIYFYQITIILITHCFISVQKKMHLAIDMHYATVFFISVSKVRNPANRILEIRFKSRIGKLNCQRNKLKRNGKTDWRVWARIDNKLFEFEVCIPSDRDSGSWDFFSWQSLPMCQCSQLIEKHVLRTAHFI